MIAKHSSLLRTSALLSLAMATLSITILSGCKKHDDGKTAPPPTQVVPVSDMNTLTVAPAEAQKFTLTTADSIQAASELKATGSVQPDVSREVPVISMANGRVVDIKARLDDTVHKGQLLLKVQSPDVTAAFNSYLKANSDAQLASRAARRAQDLYQHGAIAQANLEQAETVARDANADLIATEEQLHTLGVDKNHPSSVMPVYAPISGVIVAQNVTNASATGASLAGSSTAFTIADLSHVWIVCDVFENDIAKLQVGQEARILISAYPDKPLTGRIGDVGPILDPQMRSAKVRVEVANPGFLKLGMFATATFSSREKQTYAVVPASAVLHLHDREWVYLPVDTNHFRRQEVKAGPMLPGSRQQILSGLQPGQKVVTNALMLDAAGNQ